MTKPQPPKPRKIILTGKKVLAYYYGDKDMAKINAYHVAFVDKEFLDSYTKRAKEMTTDKVVELTEQQAVSSKEDIPHARINEEVDKIWQPENIAKMLANIREAEGFVTKIVEVDLGEIEGIPIRKSTAGIKRCIVWEGIYDDCFKYNIDRSKYLDGEYEVVV